MLTTENNESTNILTCMESFIDIQSPHPWLRKNIFFEKLEMSSCGYRPGALDPESGDVKLVAARGDESVDG